jgi:mRNA-degrading endonuclease RelE of RelBE toxin-antitoxin system
LSCAVIPHRQLRPQWDGYSCDGRGAAAFARLLQPHLPYYIDYASEIRDHLRYLTARQRSTVFDEVNQQLTHEPTAETRNRKPLRPNPLASWELRIGDLRVYYDVEEDPEQQVNIVAIGMKRRTRVSIGGELYNI